MIWINIKNKKNKSSIVMINLVIKPKKEELILENFKRKKEKMLNQNLKEVKLKIIKLDSEIIEWNLKNGVIIFNPPNFQ